MVVKEVGKVVNLDWINNQACSLSLNICYNKYFYNEQLSSSNDKENHIYQYFSEFVHQVAIKFRFRKTSQKKCFNPTLYLDTESLCRR